MLGTGGKICLLTGLSVTVTEKEKIGESRLGKRHNRQGVFFLPVYTLRYQALGISGRGSLTQCEWHSGPVRQCHECLIAPSVGCGGFPQFLH